jgi:acyl-coenzyme A thioesterase PaaI-like protein
MTRRACLATVPACLPTGKAVRQGQSGPGIPILRCRATPTRPARGCLAQPGTQVLGGHILALFDRVGSLAAQQYASARVVTRSSDCVDLHMPLPVSEIFIVRAAVVWTGRTSVRSYVELLVGGTALMHVRMKGLISYVAIDWAGPADRGYKVAM